jgi:predicted dehydrogenase
MVRCAVIGYGGAFNMGKAHAEWMNKAGMQTVAACDIDPKRMEQAAQDFPGIRTYTRQADLAADPEVDLCVVILPHNLHAEASILLTDAGKHVVVEKPMCITVAEADAMIASAQSRNVMLSVFHNRRHDGDFLAIRNLIRNGTIGDVFHIEACMGGYHAPGDWWRSDKKISGGAMYDWGAHVIDWILNLVPQKVVGVDGWYHKRMWTQMTNEDHTELSIRFEDGANANVEMSTLAAHTKPRWRILGTKGAIVMPSWDSIEVSVDHGGHIAKFSVRPEQSEWQAYYDNIAAHLQHGAELDVKPEEARRIIAIIEAAEQSSVKQATVVPAYS